MKVINYLFIHFLYLIYQIILFCITYTFNLMVLLLNRDSNELSKYVFIYRFHFDILSIFVKEREINLIQSFFIPDKVVY